MHRVPKSRWFRSSLALSAAVFLGVSGWAASAPMLSGGPAAIPGIQWGAPLELPVAAAGKALRHRLEWHLRFSRLDSSNPLA